MDGGGSLCPACLEWAGPLIEASVRMIREYKKLLRKEIAMLRSNCNSLALTTFGTMEFSLCYTKAISLRKWEDFCWRRKMTIKRARISHQKILF